MSQSLQRFRDAQEEAYDRALGELKTGRKTSHWIWYIFPQIRGLGRSTVAQYYEIQDREEALAYWEDPILSGRLKELCHVLLGLEGSAEEIMGFPDNLKLRSCMTLFWLISGEQIFMDVLDKFYGGKMDEFTKKKLL